MRSSTDQLTCFQVGMSFRHIDSQARRPVQIRGVTAAAEYWLGALTKSYSLYSTENWPRT